MPISLTCSGCGKRLKAKDTLAGRTVPCPACGAELTIGSAEDAAAALLLGDAAPPAESEAPPPDDVPPPKRTEEPRPSAPVTAPAQKPAPTPEIRSLPPLTAKEPPLWLRHLHWLLVLALIPLAGSLLQAREDKDLEQRLVETIQQAPAGPSPN
jgi:hypothetical protein